jgi:hypothetical protein
VLGHDDLAAGDAGLYAGRRAAGNDTNDVDVRIGQCGLQNAVTCSAAGSENRDLVNLSGPGIRQRLHLPIVEQIGCDTKQVEQGKSHQGRQQECAEAGPFHKT